MVNAFEEKNGIKIPFEFVPRRPGDLSQFWADATKAKTELNWEATRNLEDMVRDTWNWQRQNQNGYK